MKAVSEIEKEVIGIFLQDVSMKPMFVHDCDNCQFLGNMKVSGKNYDMFVCITPHSRNIIARYSDEPGDYLSGFDFKDKNEVLNRTFVLAKISGFFI